MNGGSLAVWIGGVTLEMGGRDVWSSCPTNVAYTVLGSCCCCMRASPSKRAARLACRAALQRKAPLRAGLLLSHLHPKPAALHSVLRPGVAPGGAVSNVTQYPNGGFPVIPPALSLPGTAWPQG